MHKSKSSISLGVYYHGDLFDKGETRRERNRRFTVIINGMVLLLYYNGLTQHFVVFNKPSSFVRDPFFN